MEQVRLKRAGLGLRGWDEEQACPGLTLFAPHGRDGSLYLIDLGGEVVHEWHLPCPAGHAYLTQRGTVICNGHTPGKNGRFIDAAPWKLGSLTEVDWRGEAIWEVRHPDHHHDGIRLANGNVLLLCLRELPYEVAKQVRGGRPGSEHEDRMYGDYLLELTTNGQAVWEWRSWEHLDPERDVIVNPQDSRKEWTHGNAVAELPDGNLVVSFRLISMVIIVERRSGNIIWKLGPPTLNNQHAPTPLPNGNLLIFDNGTHRLDDHLPYSRVIEVDPATKRVVWFYQDTPPSNFFSPIISNAQRLPNGNTLICEGTFGRLFEVTRQAEVVWEYVNPYFGRSPTGPSNSVFRAYRYSGSELPK
jgi:hypothetical protein